MNTDNDNKQRYTYWVKSTDNDEVLVEYFIAKKLKWKLYTTSLWDKLYTVKMYDHEAMLLKLSNANVSISRKFI